MFGNLVYYPHGVTIQVLALEDIVQGCKFVQFCVSIRINRAQVET